MGQILAKLRDLGLAESTLVLFTSDNGPWLSKRLEGGSAGLLREGKGSTWEGGVRVPCLAWWPGTIAPGRVAADLASELDVFATCLDLAGATTKDNHIVDGVSFVHLLKGTGPSPRSHVYYYHDSELTAIREGPWKLHVKTSNPASGQDKAQPCNPILLYHLDSDPGERSNVAKEHPEVVSRLLKKIDAHRRAVKPGVPQL